MTIRELLKQMESVPEELKDTQVVTRQYRGQAFADIVYGVQFIINTTRDGKYCLLKVSPEKVRNQDSVYVSYIE